MKNKRNVWSLLFLLLLVFLTSYYLFRNHEIGKLISTTAQANPYYLAAGLFLMFIFIASEGFGIQVLLNSLNYRRPYLKCLKYSFLGFYYCSITPSSGGQPVQIYYMTKEGIDFGDSSLCIMLISISYQIGIVLICLFSLLVKFGFIVQNLGAVKYFSILGAIVNILIVGFFISTTFHNGFIEKVISFAIMVMTKLKLVGDPEKKICQIKVQLEKYREGASYIKSNPKVILITLASIILQILTRLSIAYVVYKAFGLHGFSYLDIISLQAFLTLGVEYLPIPGSVGAMEAGFYTVNRIIFGAEKLMPAMLLTRGISFYSFLVISGIVSVLAHISMTRRMSEARMQAQKTTECEI